MSAYYDLFEKPDVNKTGKQQPLYARFIPKGTIEQKEFLNRVHLFTGISRSLLEGAMSAFMDELRDCLADGWTVELGELGYFTPSLSCQREVMEKKELRAASVRLRGLNFRVRNWIKRCSWSAIHSQRPNPNLLYHFFLWNSVSVCSKSICNSIPVSTVHSMPA